MKKVLYFLLFFLMTASFIGMDVKEARAYNYAGYRWGGYWPYVVVDTSPVSVIAWRNTIGGAMADWNAAGARFTLVNGSSNNKAYVTYQYSDAFAWSQAYRKYGFWGDVYKATITINNYHNFYPPSRSGWYYDLRSVLRHEFGHWLVLNHSYSPSVAMYNSIGVGQIKYLSSDEVNAIISIYGRR